MTTSLTDNGVQFADGSVMNSSAQLGMRNLLINANAAINQRAYVSGAATGAANQYTVDRWRVITSGQSLAFTASGNGNAMTAPAGGLEQVIEGANIGIVNAVINWVGAATCTVDGVAKTKGQTVTLVPGTNCSVKFFGGTVSLPQIEAGAVPTPFEFRPLGTELALCQRYFLRRTSAGANGIFLPGGMQSGTNTTAVDNFPTMRALPSFSWDGTLANWLVALNGATIAITAISGFPTSHGGYIIATCAASAGFASWLASANASAWLAWSAEL